MNFDVLMQLTITNSSELESQSNGQIVRESAFYSELKQASENSQQSSFALILSMLTQDALELDQFHLPQNQPIENVRDYYKQFNIQQQALEGELNEKRSLAFNHLIQSNHKRSVELELMLKPEALIAAKTSTIDDVIISNMDTNCRARYLNQQQTDHVQTETVDISKHISHKENAIDIESWFNVLEQARTLSKVA